MVAGLADLQHKTGYRSDGLEEVVLLRVAVEHAVERLAELDELALRRKGWREFISEFHHITDFYF